MCAPEGTVQGWGNVWEWFGGAGIYWRWIDQYQLTTGANDLPDDRSKAEKVRKLAENVAGGGAGNRFGGATHIGILYI